MQHFATAPPLLSLQFPLCTSPPHLGLAKDPKRTRLGLAFPANPPRTQFPTVCNTSICPRLRQELPTRTFFIPANFPPSAQSAQPPHHGPRTTDNAPLTKQTHQKRNTATQNPSSASKSHFPLDP